MAEIKTHHPELQRKLAQYITQAGSQERAATLIGYSTAALSTYRAGKYGGDVAKFEARLQEFFATQEEAQSLYSSPDYVPTSISEQVYQTIRLCHLKGGFAIECGDAGIGKTKAAKKYAADYPASAIYISVNPCFVSVTAFLKLFCRKMHLQTGGKDDMWLELDELLQGGRKVLIIDEAQHLPIKTVDTIRAFFDDNPQVGVALIGNAETVTVRNGSRRESFAQVKNRTRMTEIRHTAHVTKDDILKLFPSLQGNGREVEFLHVIAQSEQGVRGAVNLYSNAADNENTSYEGLLSMAREMKIISGF